MRIHQATQGVFAIAPTPFLDNGEIDKASVDRMTDFYHSVGCNGVTVLGIMGEAPKLGADEAIAVASRIIRRATIPIIVGVSAAGFASMRTLARALLDAGAAGVMVAPPSALRTDDQIVNYYEQAITTIGEDAPFVIQDYPLTVGVVMTPDVIRRIVEAHASVVMLKHEDWPGLEKISTLRRFQRENTMRPVSILCGNGGLFLDFETERGADGAMTGYAFPEMLIDVVNQARSGNRAAAHDVFDAHLPLLRYEQQLGIGLAVRKHVLRRRGVIAHETQRLPSTALTATARAEIDYLLTRLARVDARAALSPEA